MATETSGVAHNALTLMQSHCVAGEFRRAASRAVPSFTGFSRGKEVKERRAWRPTTTLEPNANEWPPRSIGDESDSRPSLFSRATPAGLLFVFLSVTAQHKPVKHNQASIENPGANRSKKSRFTGFLRSVASTKGSTDLFSLFSTPFCERWNKFNSAQPHTKTHTSPTV